MSDRENEEILSEIDAEITEEIEAVNSDEDDIDVDPEKAQRRKEEAEALQIAVANGASNTLIRKVAYILNRYPETRNSDVALQIQYWRAFENFTGNSINTDKLFEYERLTSITRSRQKIQNEYKLYRADNKVKRWRGNQAEIEREKQIANKPSMPILSIYADETGKNDQYVIVGSIWILDERSHGILTTRLASWVLDNTETERFPKEFHFRDVDNRGNDLEYYKTFFDLFMGNSEMVSFKAIAVNKQKLNRVSIKDLLKSLYIQLIRSGLEHEKLTNRIAAPKQISYTKDDEGESVFELNQIQQELKDMLKLQHGEDFVLNKFASLSSKPIRLLQIADLFAASLNRKYNHQVNNSNRNAKDQLANHVLNAVQLDEIHYNAEDLSKELELNSDNDRSAIFIFD